MGPTAVLVLGQMLGQMLGPLRHNQWAFLAALGRVPLARRLQMLKTRL
jgi:hypothetical protein